MFFSLFLLWYLSLAYGWPSQQQILRGGNREANQGKKKTEREREKGYCQQPRSKHLKAEADTQTQWQTSGWPRLLNPHRPFLGLLPSCTLVVAHNPTFLAHFPITWSFSRFRPTSSFRRLLPPQVENTQGAQNSRDFRRVLLATHLYSLLAMLNPSLAVWLALN